MEDPTVQQPAGLHRSPLVRLQINIQDQQVPRAQEVVKAVNKDWETVDVGGFTFRRRVQSTVKDPGDLPQQPAKKQRTEADSPATHTPSAIPAPAVQPASTSSQVQQASHVESPPIPLQIPIHPIAAITAITEDGATSTNPPGEAVQQQMPANDQQAHPADHATSPSGQDGIPTQEAAPVQPQLQTDLEAAPQNAERAREADESAQRPHEALQQPAGTAHSPEAESEGASRLQDRIDTRLLLDSLPSGASEAQRLLMLCHLLLQDQVDAAEASNDAQLARALQSMQDTLPEGLQASLESGALQTAPDLRGVPSGDQEAVQKLQLERHLASLQQEEQLWQLALQQAEATCQAPEADHQPGNEPGADARPEADALTAGDATAQEMQQQMLAGNAQPSEAPQQTAAQGTKTSGDVAAAQRDAHIRLALQVSSMAALVSQVEELVESAEMSCTMMQAEWHHKKFSRLQHLQSPARLIRELVKPRRMVVDTP